MVGCGYENIIPSLQEGGYASIGCKYGDFAMTSGTFSVFPEYPMNSLPDSREWCYAAQFNFMKLFDN